MTVYGRPGATRSDDDSAHSGVSVVETWGVESKSLSTLSYGLSAALHANRRAKPNVALVMNVANGYFLPILRAAGIRSAVNVDGIEWERAKWGRAAKSVFRRGASLTARYADTLIYDSRHLAQRWLNEYGRDGEFIPYGGDQLGPVPLSDDLRSGGYALLVARFVPENTVGEFLQAAPLIAQHHQVVLVGSSGYGGELDDTARRLAHEHENIFWLGHVNDDRRLYSLWQHAGAYFHGHTV